MSDNLEVRLMQRPNASMYIEVRLASNVRPGVMATTQVEHQGSDERTRQAVLAAGGALAEYLGGNYGDSYVASELASDASELYQEMMSDYRQALN